MKLFFKSRCYNGGNRHKYQAVYDERDRGVLPKATWVSAEEYRRIITLLDYVKHVCVWCGKEVKR